MGPRSGPNDCGAGLRGLSRCREAQGSNGAPRGDAVAADGPLAAVLEGSSPEGVPGHRDKGCCRGGSPGHQRQFCDGDREDVGQRSRVLNCQRQNTAIGVSFSENGAKLVAAALACNTSVTTLYLYGNEGGVPTFSDYFFPAFPNDLHYSIVGNPFWRRRMPIHC